MVNPASAVIDFTRSHLQFAKRMRGAHMHCDIEDATRDVDWYSSPDVATAVPDATQLLQRLPLAMQIVEKSSSFEGRELFRVTVSVERLARHPFMSLDEDDFDLEAIRCALLECFEPAHLFGCFRPYRYNNYSVSGAGGVGMFVFEADFLVWECEGVDLKRISDTLAKSESSVFPGLPVMRWHPVRPGTHVDHFIDVISIPDEQYEIGGVSTYTVFKTAMDPCAEVELKDLLRKWPFEKLILVAGEGKLLQKTIPE
ncbi:hypothetical protein NFO65_22335 [Neorhizobium galegae]|uniref:hypothetical protein n=1 Tax=Neorhizobium galegae TaxID=399 RepID=UPI0021017644|nr:hypothetical protein [Neorhizobium galegae]MCQ1573468.1 hypothetical protein [Neorhizobium galegae]